MIYLFNKSYKEHILQGKLMNRWKDWYEQGKRDYQRALLDVEHGYYEWACFTAQQASEKVIKGLGLKLGITLLGHSLLEMMKILGSNISIDDTTFERVTLLDLYYIPARYPNGFASGKPADYFSEKQAREALHAADSIIGFCESFFSQSN